MVNVTEITSLANALMLVANTHLEAQFSASRIKNEQYGQAYGNVLVGVIGKVADLVQNQPLTDAQIAQATAQTGAINSEKAIKEAQSAKDLLTKDAQIGVINAQKDVEIEKKSLTTRQKSYYDDQLRVHESDHLSRMTMGALQAGTTLPDGLLTTTLNAIASVTP